MNFPKATKNPSTGKYDKFTSIGCYPLFYVTTKNVCMCADCANKHPSDDIDLHMHGELDLTDINYEDPNLYCDICEERIESAYTEDICKIDSCDSRIMPGSEYCEDCDAGIREDIEEE